jgi:hypothetical protein
MMGFAVPLVNEEVLIFHTQMDLTLPRFDLVLLSRKNLERLPSGLGKKT